MKSLSVLSEPGAKLLMQILSTGARASGCSHELMTFCLLLSDESDVGCALCTGSGLCDGDADAAVFEFAAFDGFEEGSGDAAVDGGI